MLKKKIFSEFLQGGFCIKTKPCLLDCGSFKYSESPPLKPGDEARGANTYTATAAYSTEPTVREGMGARGTLTQPLENINPYWINRSHVH